MLQEKSKKEIIMACSARLFRKKGYKGTSMRDIAQEVGMEAASLYNHIENKQQLLRESLMTIAHLFTQGMEDVNNTSLNPTAKFEELIRLHVRLTVEHTDKISIITSEWVHLNEPNLGEYRQLRNSYETQFKSIIDACINEGTFAKVNTDIALFSTLSTLHWLYSWYSKHRDISPIELEHQMIHCLASGLKAR